jgi:hypothetical protein
MSTSSVTMQNTKQDTTIILYTHGMYKYTTIINNYLCSKDNANKLSAFKLKNLVHNNVISFIYLHMHIKLVMVWVSVINQLTDTVNDWTQMTMAKNSKLGFYVPGNRVNFILTLELQTFSNVTFDLVVLSVTGVVYNVHKDNQ